MYNALTSERLECKLSTLPRLLCTAEYPTPWSQYLEQRAFGRYGEVSPVLLWVQVGQCRKKLLRCGIDVNPGPAHAVYFASYEATKHALGGNEGESHEHHPLAAGVLHSLSWFEDSLIQNSRQWCSSHNLERCADEPF